MTRKPGRETERTKNKRGKGRRIRDTMNGREYKGDKEGGGE